MDQSEKSDITKRHPIPLNIQTFMNAFPGVNSPRGYAFTGDDLIDAYNVDAHQITKAIDKSSPRVADRLEAPQIFEISKMAV